jgi:hypothetical protein
MEEPLRYFLERTTPLGTLARTHRQRRLRKKYQRWVRSGAVPPLPNWGKQRVVIEYVRRFAPTVFLETGTYKGKMVYAVMPHVQEIYSIELDPTHYRHAHRRFAGYANIHIRQGQSGDVLPEIVKEVQQPCLFWLDAHWSGGSTAKAELETPIMEEMNCILNHPLADRHVILIDDARCFTGQNDYPTLQVLEQRIGAAQPDWVFEVEDDIIRTHAKESPEEPR